MKNLVLLILGVLLAASSATAQIELVSGDYFPAEFEFSELQKITARQEFEDPARLKNVQDGSLIEDVGFVRYAKRTYSTIGKGSLTIEIATLLDIRAAYSLLTLLRSGNMQDGPPGDTYTVTANGLLFCQSKIWVRIQGTGASEELMKRIAVSVSNRIGARNPKPPSLVSRLPRHGLDRSSLRYYPGVKAFRAFSEKVGGIPLQIDTDAEIVQARYSLDNHTGTLSLLSFPTKEVAEDYFAGISARQAEKINGQKTYVKKAGPIVGILIGPFDAGSANRILSTIQYSYSVKWVYEKGQGQKKVVWGVPVGILSTVVKSLFFVVLLFAASILVGVGVALLRAALKKRAPKRSPDGQDPDEITRLKMR